MPNGIATPKAIYLKYKLKFFTALAQITLTLNKMQQFSDRVTTKWLADKLIIKINL